VSSEDVGHVLLREAAAVAPGRIVYLAHTPQFYPFGPESWHADAAAAELVRGAAQVVVIGEHMAGYVRRHLGRGAAVVHPPIYGGPPYREFGRFGSGFVLMVNPCVVKGIAIFLEMARQYPEVEFAALNGWGTTQADREALAQLPNARLLGNVPDIEEVLAGARLLLMPSVWYEGFGLIAMEAMLRGLPVIASDSGGLQEAKGGTGYVIPVKPVERYEPVFDETHMPKAVAPAQDMAPWAAALERLLTDEAEYWAEARRSREAALRFFERMLLALAPAAQPLRDEEKLRALDAQKRALLLARLRKKAQA
jgi:glycosyltransferase involved in cell wall biosynthesis